MVTRYANIHAISHHPRSHHFLGILHMKLHHPSSGAPPPPPPLSSYPCYVSPTPPFQAQGNCPPASIQSCQYPPPNPYTFLPDASHLASPFQSFVILIVSLVVLF
ncbi:hypothetical protein SLE2022_019620 [Rubroshorea leprosula]